jgi:hypothetical protein
MKPKRPPKPPALPRRGYSTNDAANYLNRAPITLRGWRCKGTGPAFRLVNGRALYDVADLDAWLEGHRKFCSTSEVTVAATAVA